MFGCQIGSTFLRVKRFRLESRLAFAENSFPLHFMGGSWVFHFFHNGVGIAIVENPVSLSRDCILLPSALLSSASLHFAGAAGRTENFLVVPR